MTNFIPLNGGLGVAVACTGTSARGAFPSLANSQRADMLAITNTGTDAIFVALGDSSVTATTACMAVNPGTMYVQMPTAGSAVAPTYVAGITGGGSYTLQVTLGNPGPT